MSRPALIVGAGIGGLSASLTLLGAGSGIDLTGMVPAFAPTELERLAGCLGRLFPHVERDRVAIAGGVALERILEHKVQMLSRASVSAGTGRPGVRVARLGAACRRRS